MKNHETAAIQQDFPGWGVWLSAHGDFWGASRRTPTVGTDQTVIRDSAGELREALRQQAELVTHGERLRGA